MFTERASSSHSAERGMSLRATPRTEETTATVTSGQPCGGASTEVRSDIQEPPALGSLPEGGGAVYARDPFGNMIELCKIPSPEESPENLPGFRKLGNFEG